MTRKNSHTGIAIAIAWPQTFCKQPGAWYDSILKKTGINNNYYYKVGHAATILIDRKSATCHYFDFGRYHTPFQHGRVRSANTDIDLKISTKAVFNSRNKLGNFDEILSEVQQNESCHGEGDLYASYSSINFDKAFNKAMHLQKISPIPYGPFRKNGSNCSRFVNKVLKAGDPGFKYKFLLRFMMPLTPTPINNVNSFSNKTKITDTETIVLFTPPGILTKSILREVLPAPDRHHSIPKNAQWLGGEGAGSWFAFELKDSFLKVTRYSPEGIVECSGIYQCKDNRNRISATSLRIDYPSNCKEITLSGDNNKIRFEILEQI